MAILRQQSPTRPVGKDHNQETLEGYTGVPFIVITVAILVSAYKQQSPSR